MNILKYFWISLLLVCTFIVSIRGFRENVCSRLNYVTYIKNEFEDVFSPHYIWRSFNENQWYPNIKYKYETQYYCCPGYEGSTYDCKPKCDTRCSDNSHCTAPNKCSCDDGYSGKDCKPVCRDCGKNSICVAPNVCRCNAGYRQIANKGDCVPQCKEPCGDHSFCSAPNSCECEVGYQSISNSSTCEPICTFSCSANSYCKEPEHCVCQTGYKLAEDESGICKPICDVDCGPNSSCIRPGECQCNEGYLIQNGTCQPICSLGCQAHSNCTAPDHCECNEGYHQSVENVCQPICPERCLPYASCVSPNVCQCYPGYEMSEQECKPKCSQGCPNGYCFAPQICACNPGYLMGFNSSCEPQCRETCIHGYCSQPEICECEPGFRFVQDSQHICEPICEPNCQNGDCMAPQTCICHIGYEPEDSAMGHVCKPSCQVNCVNGTCVSPDECSCFPGFKPSVEGNSSICQPNCSKGCQNGLCTGPDTCQCNAGFTNTSDGCQLLMTTEIDSSSTFHPPLEILMEPSTNCTSKCRCWSEFTGADNATPVKCINICIDAYDQPCLDPARCRCNQQTESSQLLCDVDDPKQSRTFVCQVVSIQKSNSTGNLTTKEAVFNSSKTAQSSIKWPTILLGCMSICILLMSVMAVIHYYLKHRNQQEVVRRSNELGIMSIDNDL